MSVELATALAGIAINLIALLIAVGRILSANTASEVRQAERFVRIEADVVHMGADITARGDRLEKDVQTLYELHRSHLHDFHSTHSA